MTTVTHTLLLDDCKNICENNVMADFALLAKKTFANHCTQLIRWDKVFVAFTVNFQPVTEAARKWRDFATAHQQSDCPLWKILLYWWVHFALLRENHCHTYLKWTQETFRGHSVLRQFERWCQLIPAGTKTSKIILFSSKLLCNGRLK